MDYVVFGTGFGASVLVLGLIVREVGPRLRFRHPADGGEVLHAEDLVAKIAWSRFCVALGSVLAIAGAVFLAATLACIILMVSDRTGGWVMLGTLTAIILLLFYWTWAFFDRFGSYGILPERDEEDVEEEVAVATAQVRPATRRAVGPPAPSEAGATSPTASAFGPVVPPTVTTESSTEDEAKSGGEAATDTTPETPRLETPEERLANAEAPLEHGSAEADLNIATNGGGRSSLRPGARRAERGARQGTGDTEEVTDAETPADKPDGDAGTADDANDLKKEDT